jgi:signal transduction histidine kinase
VSLPATFDGRNAVTLLTPLVLFAIAGATVGYLVALLRNAEITVAAARAREEVARTLHDGVMQTLALVERRTDDRQLAAIVREQERELRAFLASPVGRARQNGEPDGDLAAQLRAAAARFERTYPGRAEIVMSDDLPALESIKVRALTGAIGEALNNAGKHGGAQRVVIYVERDDTHHDRTGRPSRRAQVFCSVKDDGVGFDPGSIVEGLGLTQSIRGRVEEVGGRAEVAANEGAGAEVRLWV